MDDFGLDRPELNGSLVSMQFGNGGRIQQIWAVDPAHPGEGDEFPFVLPPLAFGEEFAEDYFPGTIMIGARIQPGEPWILSRNTTATQQEEDVDAGAITFRYEFSLLPEVVATGRFYELPGSMPQICWDLELTNDGHTDLEIGELAFPFALDNFYEGFAKTDHGAKELWDRRLYVHPFIGGAASYLFAQRLNAEPPGLIITPGDDTNWEFFTHAPASLTSPYRWEGIPIVYIHSQATIERERWSPWFNGHTTGLFAPGETRRYQTRFLPADRDRVQSVSLGLQLSGRPTVRLFPAAVIPAEIGIGLEVSGATPTRFTTDVPCNLDTDADPEGGFCFAHPEKPGPVRVSFEDTQGRTSHAHLLFIEPIEDLIRQRAKWIVENQVCTDKGTFEGAIVPIELQSGGKFTDFRQYATPHAVLGSLADALFLAEKNAIYPDKAQIAVLERYIDGFLRRRLQNPADGSVGSFFLSEGSVASGVATPAVYALAANLYHAMGRVAKSGAKTGWNQARYLGEGLRTFEALMARGFQRGRRWAGLPGITSLCQLPRDLRDLGDEPSAQRMSALLRQRFVEVARRRVPFAPESAWSADGFEEAFVAAIELGHEDSLERMLDAACAARSLAPSWWWYGSDKRFADDAEGPHPAVEDKGELCLGPTSSGNAIPFFMLMERDYANLPDTYLRNAFGGLMGVWALVRSDGAAAMAYCPDSASGHFGMSWFSGEVGLGLWNYLRAIGSYVLPSRQGGVATLGCRFEMERAKGEEIYVIRPWDGVRRKVVARQLGVEAHAEGVQIEELRFDALKRHAAITLVNPAGFKREGRVRLRGLWGDEFMVAGSAAKAIDGEIALKMPLKAGESARMEIRGAS